MADASTPLERTERTERKPGAETRATEKTPIGSALVQMRAERAALERRLYEVRQAIEAKINECDHEWVRMREDGPYGERYRYCAKCDTCV